MIIFLLNLILSGMITVIFAVLFIRFLFVPFMKFILRQTEKIMEEMERKDR
jgi:hypothetical protein